jgi:hypothetical protein
MMFGGVVWCGVLRSKNYNSIETIFKFFRLRWKDRPDGVGWRIGKAPCNGTSLRSLGPRGPARAPEFKTALFIVCLFLIEFFRAAWAYHRYRYRYCYYLSDNVTLKTSNIRD